LTFKNDVIILNKNLTKGVNMGATNEYYELKCSIEDLEGEVDILREQARFDHGNSGYTGTIAEDSGLEVIGKVMSLDDAENYIEENAEKWDDSIAVPINKEKTKWLVGGCYSC
jgi:hypothetical protein